MLVRDLIADFRSEAQDEAAPYLWSPAEVLRYANDAQRRACRETRGIADALTPAVCTLRMAADQPYAALHPAVRQIRWARRASDGRELQILNVGGAETARAADYGTSFAQDPYSRSGEVYALLLGESDGWVRWLATPAADDSVSLAVFRNPLYELASPGDELELSDEFAPALLKWMLHRAYAKRDAETNNAELSTRYRAEFDAECAALRRTQERLVHRPRAVAYGGL
jgi:hypothetical protein